MDILITHKNLKNGTTYNEKLSERLEHIEFEDRIYVDNLTLKDCINIIKLINQKTKKNYPCKVFHHTDETYVIVVC